MAWFILSAACLYGAYRMACSVSLARDRWDEWDRMLEDYDHSQQEKHHAPTHLHDSR